MKYTMLKSPYRVVIKNKDIPEPKKDQVCIKVAYCGICGTDKIMAKNWCKDWTAFGHEISGIIPQNRLECQYHHCRKVVVKPGSFCGECPAC